MVFGSLCFPALRAHGGAEGEEGGAWPSAPWGIGTHGQRVSTPGARAVSPRPGWCVCVTARLPLALSHPLLIPLLEQGGEQGPLPPLSASHLRLG